MEKRINIFDVEIDGFTAKAAMKAAVEYMQSESINTIEIVTLDMLMRGQDSPEWKEETKEIDLVLPGEKEILEAAEVLDKSLLKDVTNKMFLKMFLRYLQRNRKRIFLIADSMQELENLRQALEKYNRGIIVVGTGILDAEGKAKEEVINDVNGAETDCIFSVLPSPQQEAFIVQNRNLLNARVWLGCGRTLAQNYGERPAGGVRRFIIKKMFRYRVEKQKKET